MLRGLGVLRWVSLVWVIGVAIWSHRFLRHPVVLIIVLIAATAVTVTSTRFAVRDTARALRLPTVVADLLTALSLYLLDGFAFKAHHVFNPGQSVTASWPVCAVASAGIAFGPAAGFAAGLLMALGRYLSAILNGYKGPWNGAVLGSLANTAVFSSIWGFIAGWIAMHLRRAENEVATVRAREDFARTMHDGVLQTLSLVQRRSRATDPQLADAAKRTDRELRSYLFGGADREATMLVAGVRAVVDRAALDHDLPVEMTAVDDGESEPAADVRKALIGATAEALANAAKHASATRVTVFVDTAAGPNENRTLITIADNGVGFAINDTDPSRRGITGSIRARMNEAGGAVEIRSTPGNGTEVELWGP